MGPGQMRNTRREIHFGWFQDSRNWNAQPQSVFLFLFFSTLLFLTEVFQLASCVSLTLYCTVSSRFIETFVSCEATPDECCPHMQSCVCVWFCYNVEHKGNTWVETFKISNHFKIVRKYVRFVLIIIRITFKGLKST